MQRPDWKIAGAAGLTIGLTVGGFSLVSAGGLDRAARNIEIQGERVSASPGALMLVDDVSASPSASARPTATDSVMDSATVSPADSVASASISAASISADSVSASLDSPDPTATAQVAAADSVDSSASVASIASVDSADSADSSD